MLFCGETARVQGKGVVTGMESTTILLKDNGKDLYVTGDDIYYIESQHNNLVFTLKDRKVSNKGTIKNIMESLNGQFCHIHRSYIVNLSHIKGRDKNDLLMPDGQKIPVSRHRLTNFKKQYVNYLKNSL